MYLGDYVRISHLNDAADLGGGVDSSPRFPKRSRIRFVGNDEQALTIGKVEFQRPTLQHFLQRGSEKVLG
jgi:hypothetical protein